MKRKVLAILVIFFMFGTTIVVSSNNDIEDKNCLATIDFGNLYGYVNDTYGNPIQDALVRVHFHESYEEDYTDEFGYYHVTNIPLCWCMKNATASKEGYSTECVLLAIYEHTYYDFVLEQIGPIPDLYCEGDLYFNDIKPGSTVAGDFIVENIGDDGSELDWEVESWPEWGTWTFDPKEGLDLIPGDSLTITFEIVAPNEPMSEYDGEIKIINTNSPNDYCIIEPSLITSINKQIKSISYFYQSNFLKKINNNIPYIYQIIISLIIQQKNFFNNKDNLSEDQKIIAHEGVNGYVR